MPSLLLLAAAALPTLPSSLCLTLLQAVTPWTLAAEGVTRTLAQFVFVRGARRLREEAALPQTEERLLVMLQENRRLRRMYERQEAVFGEVDVEAACTVEAIVHSPLNNLNDFQPEVLMDHVRSVMDEEMGSWYREDYPRPEEEDEATETLEVDNFQRKILPWEEVAKADVEKRKKQDIIVVASLLDKM